MIVTERNMLPRLFRTWFRDGPCGTGGELPLKAAGNCSPRTILGPFLIVVMAGIVCSEIGTESALLCLSFS